MSVPPYESEPPRPTPGTSLRQLTSSLRELRKWANLTLDALQRHDRTLPRSTVSAVERGERPLTWEFTGAFVAACLTCAGLSPAAVRTELAHWRRALNTARPGAEAEGVAARGCSTMPRDIGDFTGRAEEMNELIARITEGEHTVAIHAIDGMGGVGKTTFAVRLAHLLMSRYPDGQLFIDLQAHTAGEVPLEPQEALGRLLALLKVVPAREPSSIGEWSELWRAELRHRRLLIVLDNAAGSDQVEPLLPGDSNSLVLVTSRRRLEGLRARGVATYSLDVLPHHAAVALFVRIVGEPRTESDPAAVDRVVELCGRLPLAVRLVACRLAMRPVWTVADLADELTRARSRLAEMRAENLSVRAAFELSYRVLTVPERIQFRWLGLHPPGEIGVAAAAALAGTGGDDGRAMMEELAACSLIREVRRHHYRLHDLMREYAREKAADEDPRADRKQAVGRVLDHYLRCALHAHSMLLPHRVIDDTCGPDDESPPEAVDGRDLGTPRAAMEWFDSERDNLLASGSMATEYDQQSYLWRIPRAMSHYLALRGNLKDAGTLFALGLTWAALNHDQRAIADMTAANAEVQHVQGADAAAISGFAGACETYRRIGDNIRAADMLNRIGISYRMTANNERALVEHRAALEEFIGLGDEYGQAESHYLIAMVHRVTGAFDVALHHHQRAIELYRALGFGLGIARSVANIAVINSMRGDYQEALRLYPAALETYREMGDQRGVANTLNNTAAALGRVGRLSEALASQEEAVKIFREIGNANGVADGLLVGGMLWREAGDHRESVNQLKESLAINRANSARLGTAGACLEMSITMCDAGHADRALPIADEAVAIYREIANVRGEAKALLQTVRCLLALGEVGDANARASQARELAALHSLTDQERQACDLMNCEGERMPSAVEVRSDRWTA